MFSVYVLQSQKDGKFYIGLTHDLTKRFQRHNDGRVSSTKVRTPFVIVHSELYATRREEIERETYLKRLKGNQQFRCLMFGYKMESTVLSKHHHQNCNKDSQ